MTKPHLLLDLAAQYSRAYLHSSGDVFPTLMAITSDDILVFSVPPLSELAGTKKFSKAARLIATGFPVESLVIIFKMWSIFTTEEDQPQVLPSQSPERREAVLLSVESRNGNQQQLLFVKRDAAGRFIDFETGDHRPFDTAEGPIFGILSVATSNPTDASTARARLSTMGIFLGKISRSEIAPAYRQENPWDSTP